jgi:hypothetical protein
MVSLLLSHNGYSACSKDDIQFYLEKGFTQDQITQLCAASGASKVPDYQPYQQKVIIYSTEEAPGVKDGFTREERAAIKDLKLGADVRELSVDQEQIKFITQICLAVQEGKEFDQRYKICPEIDVVVERAGLSAIASGKKYGILGTKQLIIQGDIKRTLVRSEEQFPAKYKKRLLQLYEHKTSKPEMSVPIRGDFSTTRLYDAVTALSKAAEPGTALAQSKIDEDLDENELVLEDEPSKKKKRWWNPFD